MFSVVVGIQEGGGVVGEGRGCDCCSIEVRTE